MEERKARGSVIAGYFKFIRKTWGKEGLDDCLSVLKIDMKSIKEGNWYHDQLSTNIIAWIAEKKGEEFLEKCGRYTVKDLGLLAYVVRFMDIKSILKRGPQSYRDAFNYGYLKVDIGEKKAKIFLKGHAPFDKHGCRMWLGVFNGMLEMTRTTGRVIETKCEGKGAPLCEYEMEWQ